MGEREWVLVLGRPGRVLAVGVSTCSSGAAVTPEVDSPSWPFPPGAAHPAGEAGSLSLRSQESPLGICLFSSFALAAVKLLFGQRWVGRDD